MIVALSVLECTMIPWSQEHTLHHELFIRSGTQEMNNVPIFQAIFYLSVRMTSPGLDSHPILFLLISSKPYSPNPGMSPRDAQRADKKQIAGRRRKERPLMGKKCVIFPEGGLSWYDIQPLY
jgi:hypothetical protein